MLDLEWKSGIAMTPCLHSKFKIGWHVSHSFPEVNGFSSGIRGAADWRVGGPQFPSRVARLVWPAKQIVHYAEAPLIDD